MTFWKNKEFLTLLSDTVISFALFFGAKYLIPSTFEDVQFVILGVQPIILAIIGFWVAEKVKAQVIAPVTAFLLSQERREKDPS